MVDLLIDVAAPRPGSPGTPYITKSTEDVLFTMHWSSPTDQWSLPVDRYQLVCRSVSCVISFVKYPKMSLFTMLLIATLLIIAGSWIISYAFSYIELKDFHYVIL